jgi:hypothetical protein
VKARCHHASAVVQNVWRVQGQRICALVFERRTRVSERLRCNNCKESKEKNKHFVFVSCLRNKKKKKKTFFFSLFQLPLATGVHGSFCSSSIEKQRRAKTDNAKATTFTTLHAKATPSQRVVKKKT